MPCDACRVRFLGRQRGEGSDRWKRRSLSGLALRASGCRRYGRTVTSAGATTHGHSRVGALLRQTHWLSSTSEGPRPAGRLLFRKWLDSYITLVTYYLVPAATTLQVLSNPSRHAIVELLRGGEHPVGKLVEHLSLSQPAVSKHLRVLKEAGIVEVRSDAQRRLYRLRPEPFVELEGWLAGYREVWNEHLDRLELHLDRRRSS